MLQSIRNPIGAGKHSMHTFRMVVDQLTIQDEAGVHSREKPEDVDAALAMKPNARFIKFGSPNLGSLRLRRSCLIWVESIPV